MSARSFAYLLLLLSSSVVVACEDTSGSAPEPPDTVPENPTPPSKCTEPSGPAIEHGSSIDTDETWGAGLHRVTFNVEVHKGATLTLAPCAVVEVAKDYGITVGSGDDDRGSLVAEGEPAKHITVRGVDGAAWSQLLVYIGGHASLAYVDLIGGGGESSRSGGTIHLRGDVRQPTIQGLMSAKHVKVEKSGRFGVVLEERGAFESGSEDLSISGSGNEAMLATAPSLGTIPAGTYTGNTVDAIRIVGGQSWDVIDADVTIHDRGVPYIVGAESSYGTMSVLGAAGTDPVLTIEPGVTLQFGVAPESALYVHTQFESSERGALHAVGTADKPIVFTSSKATPAPGDWMGIYFLGKPSPKSKIDFARIEYAGANSTIRGYSCGTPPSDDKISNEASIAIFAEPSRAFVTNTTIAKSSANGIERAWSGAVIDFGPTNTFTDVAYCQQTYPKNLQGQCPQDPPCPR